MDNLNNLPTPNDLLTTAGFVPINTPEPGHLEELIQEFPPPNELTNNKQLTTPRWEVTKVMPRHREIMRRILEGATYIQIAESMGMHKQTIMLICTSALFKAELNKLEASADFTVLRRAEEMSNEALDTLKVLMRNARSESVRKASADSILDRAGYSKIEKKIIGVVDGEAVIRELGRRRREAQMALEVEVVPA